MPWNWPGTLRPPARMQWLRSRPWLSPTTSKPRSPTTQLLARPLICLSIVYWIARTAAAGVTAEQFLAAMAAVPNFSGLKFTDSNFYLFQRLVQLGGDRLNLISGPDEICLGGMVAGSDAAIGSTYNIMPKLFLEMRRYFEASDIRPAMALQARANEVIATLFHFDLLGAVKEILTMRGLPVGPARPPHIPLDEAARTALGRALDDLGFAVE